MVPVTDNLPLSDLPVLPKKVAVVLIAAILATGLIEHQSVSVMQELDARPDFCPRFDADGRQLKASMVMETYIKGALKPHECHYAYRSDR